MSDAAKKEEVPTRSLVRKLSEVMGEVKRIAKNGRNDHFGYDFATEADIAEAVRDEMAKRHLMLFPNVVNEQWEKVPRKNGGETKLCTLTVEFTVEDGDSGETRVFHMKGQGEDALDKATYKAMTGAEKYALLKLFMIPTGDDPERTSEHRFVPAKESPPAANTNAPASSPKSASGLKAQFGKAKGKTPSEMDEENLSWYLGAAKKAVDAKDPKWHEKNVAWLSALQAEAQRRITNATGKVSAPANTSPRQASLPVDGEEEIVTPMAGFTRLARELNLPLVDVMKRAKGALNGKEAGFTHEDVAVVRSSLLAVPAR